VKALVVGGTGPTGPLIVQGLLERGYDVAILHRGTHEVELPAAVEHIHADPHFRETLDEALQGRSFELVIATYGRLRFVAEALVGKTPRLITVGGTAGYRGSLAPETNFPAGLPIPTQESATLVASEQEFRFAYLIALTEQVIMQGEREGHYRATHFRYPLVYGPHQLGSPVWPVMRRILDGRSHIVLPDGGLTLLTRGYVANLAHAILLAVDRPDASAGQIYNCGDEQVLTLRQWVEVIASTMDHQWEIYGVPDSVSHSSRDFVPFQGSSNHQMMDLAKIRTELGYKDLIPALEAIPLTVRWYMDNPPDGGAQADLRRGYPYNYPAEDELVALAKDALRSMGKVTHEERSVHHPYPHPKEPRLGRDHRRR
jgi:nucleoside-diphosphate-sugar epimerase